MKLDRREIFAKLLYVYYSCIVDVEYFFQNETILHLLKNDYKLFNFDSSWYFSTTDDRFTWFSGWLIHRKNGLFCQKLIEIWWNHTRTEIFRAIYAWLHHNVLKKCNALFFPQHMNKERLQQHLLEQNVIKF